MKKYKISFFLNGREYDDIIRANSEEEARQEVYDWYIEEAINEFLPTVEEWDEEE